MVLGVHQPNPFGPHSSHLQHLTLILMLLTKKLEIVITEQKKLAIYESILLRDLNYRRTQDQGLSYVQI